MACDAPLGSSAQGFRKVDTDRWEFGNDNFIRGRKDLLKEIHRRKALASGPGSGSIAVPPASTLVQTHNAAVELQSGFLYEEVESLNRDKNVLMMEMVRIRQQQLQVTDQRMRDIETGLEQTESRQQAIITFLQKVAQNLGLLTSMFAAAQSVWSLSEPSNGNKKRRQFHKVDANPEDPAACGDEEEHGDHEMVSYNAVAHDFSEDFMRQFSDLVGNAGGASVGSSLNDINSLDNLEGLKENGTESAVAVPDLELDHLDSGGVGSPIFTMQVSGGPTTSTAISQNASSFSLKPGQPPLVVATKTVPNHRCARSPEVPTPGLPSVVAIPSRAASSGPAAPMVLPLHPSQIHPIQRVPKVPTDPLALVSGPAALGPPSFVPMAVPTSIGPQIPSPDMEAAANPGVDKLLKATQIRTTSVPQSMAMEFGATLPPDVLLSAGAMLPSISEEVAPSEDLGLPFHLFQHLATLGTGELLPDDPLKNDYLLQQLFELANKPGHRDEWDGRSGLSCLHDCHMTRGPRGCRMWYEGCCLTGAPQTWLS